MTQNNQQPYPLNAFDSIASVLRTYGALKPQFRYKLLPEQQYVINLIVTDDISLPVADSVKDLFAACGFRIIPATTSQADNEIWSKDEGYTNWVIDSISQHISKTIDNSSNKTLRQNYSDKDRMVATVRYFVDKLHRYGHVLSYKSE